MQTPVVSHRAPAPSRSAGGTTPSGAGLTAALLALALMLILPASARAQEALVIRALTEKRTAQLPSGPLFWRAETFPTLAAARAAEGPNSLVAESDGRVWLLTLGPRGGATPGGTRVAEIGPLPIVRAAEYLLRINEATGSPGSITSVHTHPGSEAFYVLAGEQSIRTPTGTIRIPAGRSEAGPGAGTPLEVSSSGATDLLALVMFVVDANQPFSSPARLPLVLPSALPRTGAAPAAGFFPWPAVLGAAVLAIGASRRRHSRLGATVPFWRRRA